MEPTNNPLIPQIRAASRLLVRELGFMSTALAGTSLPPAAVHTIIELGAPDTTKTALGLCQTLNLEPSSFIQTLMKLTQSGLIPELSGENENLELELTHKGKDCLEHINAFAEKQVCDALAHLFPPSSAEEILHGLERYGHALRGQRLGALSADARLSEDGMERGKGKAKRTNPEIEILKGYRPGIVGRCLDMHISYYSQAHGFGAEFESGLAKGLGDLCERLGKKGNEVWYAVKGGSGEIVGTVWVDGDDLGEGKAHLRAFVVGEGVRGEGVGRKLIGKVVRFVEEKGFKELHLWTFKGLDAARRLYDHFGFLLLDERLGTQWGKEVMEQHFVRKSSQ